MRVFYLAILGLAAIANGGDALAAESRAYSVVAGPSAAMISAISHGIRIDADGVSRKERTSIPGLAPRTVAPTSSGGPIQLAQLADPVNSGNPAVAPLKWVGMLINPTPTKDHPNEIAYCTGQFIKPNVVLTAGHCIKDLPSNPTGPWYDLSKQTFVLQYQNGEGSQTFKTKCAAASPQWTYPANYNSMTADQQNIAYLNAAQHDFALVLVDGVSPTGVMPYALDWKGKTNGATRVGYADDILDGQIIQDSYGIVFFADAIPMFPQSFPNLVVNWQPLTDLTSGTSGGAWIVNYDAAEGPNKNVLIAVNSFIDSDYPGAMVAAYLTAAEFNPLLAYVSNGCK